MGVGVAVEVSELVGVPVILAVVEGDAVPLGVREVDPVCDDVEEGTSGRVADALAVTLADAVALGEGINVPCTARKNNGKGRPTRNYKV